MVLNGVIVNVHNHFYQTYYYCQRFLSSCGPQAVAKLKNILKIERHQYQIGKRRKR